MTARTLRREATSLAVFFALALAATFPLALHFRSAIPLGGDSWMYYWNLWWVRRATLTLHASPFFTADLYYPYGAGLLFHTLNVLPGFLALPIARVVGLTAAYNAIALASFVLSGYGAYRLSRYVLARAAGGDGHSTSAFLAAVIAGAAFSFSSYRYVHLLGHLDLVSTESIPFFALFLLKTRNERGGTNPLLCGLFLAATFLTASYYFVFLLAFTGMIAIHTAVLGREPRASLLRMAAAVFTCGVLVAPVLVPMLAQGATAGRAPNPAYDVDRFSADLVSFVVPSPLHPLWKPAVVPLFQTFVRNGNIEAVTFLGFVPLVFAAIALRRSLGTAWALGAAAFAVLALGPTLHVLGHVVPFVPRWLMPYTWMSGLPYGDIPRVPARFVVMTMLCLSSLVGLGASAILRERSARSALAWTMVAGLLIVGENAVVPLPLAMVQAPPFYAALRGEAVHGGLLEVPIPDDPAEFPQRMLYQTVHELPVYGGYLARGLPPLAFEAVPGFGQLKTGTESIDDIIPYDAAQLLAMSRTVLAAYRVGEIVIDRHLLTPEKVQQERGIAEKMLGAFPSYEDRDVVAFTVRAPARFETGAWLDTGWSYLERTSARPGERLDRWRWIGDEARLGVSATAASKVRLRFTGQAFGHDRFLAVRLQDRDVALAQVFSATASRYESSPFDVPAGISFIQLESLQPAESPNTSDHRRLSVAFHAMEVVWSP